MFIVTSYPLAVVFCFVTMLCWGSWANTQKLSRGRWPFPLFYWDYSLGILLTSLILAFTMGSIGEFGRSFQDDLMQASLAALGNALIGGIIFNLANLLLVIAIDISGMAIAFPIGIGLALVIGVITNYAPSESGQAWLMTAGVITILLGILLDAAAYKQLPANGNSPATKGIFYSILAGVTMGFFYKYVSASLAIDFSFPESGKLTPYTAMVVFSLGILASNFIFNWFLMRQPINGRRSTFQEYFKGNARMHGIGILGGSIWGIGMLFNLLASKTAGAALAYGLGQGATMIAAVWGVFVWKEFASLHASKKWIIYTMFAFFLIGIGLLVYSKII
ncbi:MAG: GRP family sugar transporter [Cytophagaceae bacterium]|jgi:glucose uptake protein|nr:GRP family sugar transporter [Cytophagaceae bacterium]